MKMEGDPHVTAWGVMRGQALDLITPQQVVGGLFLMNAEEKACIALQPRLEILEEQGELMSAPHPLLSQHDEPLPGAGGEPQVGGGRCQSRSATAEPWSGEEDGRLTLCTLNYAQNSPSPIYKPSMDEQMPPLIIAPSENAHLPLCPAPFSQESEQNLEGSLPHRDDLLDVHSLFRSDHNAPVSALDSHQVPVPMNGLSSDLQFGVGGEVPLANDQITPVESCLPLKTDQPCPADPDVELLPYRNSNHSPDCLEPGWDQLGDVQDIEAESLPQVESHLVSNRLPQFDPNPVQLPWSQFCEELDSKQLPLTKSFVDVQITLDLVTNPDQLPQTESNLDTDSEQLPQTESDLDSDSKMPQSELDLDPHLQQLPKIESDFDLALVQVPQTESHLDLHPDLMPQIESNLDSYPEQVPQTESNLDPFPDQLPQTESDLDSDSKQMPQSELDLDPHLQQLLETGSDFDLGLEQVSQTESNLDSHPDQVPQTESDLEPLPDQLPQSESDLESDSKQKPQSELDLDPHLQQLPNTESDLDLALEQVSQTESDLDPHLQQLPQTESDLDPDSEQLPQTESILDSDSKQIPQPELDLDPDSEQLPQTESVLDPHPEQLPQTESDLDPDSEQSDSKQMPQSELDLYPHPEQLPQTESDLDPDSEQLPQTESVLDSHPNRLPQTKSDLVSHPEHLHQTESNLYPHPEQLPQTESVLDPDSEQLPQTESVLDPDSEQLPQTESVLDPDPEQLPQTESDLDSDSEQSDSKQMPQSELDLDPHLQQLPKIGSDLDLALEQVSQTESDLDPDSEQLPQTESVLDPHLNQLPQIKSDLGSHPDQLPQTESDLDSDSEQWHLTESDLDPHLQQLPKTESDLDSDSEQVPQTESFLNSFPEQLLQTETDLNADSEQWSQTELNLVSHPERLPQTELHLYPHPEQLPQTESDSDPDADQWPQSDSDLDPGSKQWHQTESVLDSHPEQIPQTDPDLDPNPEELPSSWPTILGEKLSHCYLDPDIDELTQFDLDLKQLPLKESYTVTKELCQSISHLDPDPEKVVQSQPYFHPITDHLSQSETESCLTPDRDIPCPPQTSLDVCVDTVEPKLLPSPVTFDLLLHSRSCLEPNTGPLPLQDQHFNHEELPHSQPLQDCDTEPLAYLCPNISEPEPHLDTNELGLDLSINHLHHCLESDPEIFSLTESFMAHWAEHTVESLVPTIDPLTMPKLSGLKPDSGHLQEELPYLDSNNFLISDLLPHSVLSLDDDQIPKTGSVLDHDPDPLPWFELSMCSSAAQLPFSTHSLNEGESLAHEADELSLCDPFLAPDHYELSVSNSAPSTTDRLTLADTYLEPDDGQPPTRESFSDMDHTTLPDPVMVADLEKLHQSKSIVTPNIQHVLQTGSLLHRDSDRPVESCLDNNLLPKVEGCLDSDNVPIPAPPCTDIVRLPGLESNLSIDCMELDGRPGFESCLTIDDDLFCLSETFLAYDMDQIPVLDHSRIPETDPLPLSEPFQKLDDDQTEPCRPLECDPLPQPETLLSPADQLPLLDCHQLPTSECPLSSSNDQLPQFESCSGPISNQLTNAEFCLHPENNIDQVAQCKPCLGTSYGPLTQLESCNLEQSMLSDSCLYQENEQFSPLESCLGQNDNNLSPSETSLGSDTDHIESQLYPSSDQLAQSKSHLVPSSDLLPQVEPALVLEVDELSHCKSHIEHPQSVPDAGQLQTYFHHEFDQFSLSESQQTPNTIQPSIDSTNAPNHFHLVAAPLCPNTDVLSIAHNPDTMSSPLFESPLALHGDHLSLSESFVTPVVDMSPLMEPAVVPTHGEEPFSESLAPNINHFKFLESSVPPTTTTQFPLLEPSVPSNTMPLPLFDQLAPLAFFEPSTPHFPTPETPESINSTIVPLYDSSVTLNIPPITNLPSRTPEEDQLPWDWTLNLHQVDLSEGSLCSELPKNSAKQDYEPEDSFALFCFDTPPDCSLVTPEADHTLSDDLLSLCDVFSHLQTDDLIHSQSGQMPISITGQTDHHDEGDQLLNSTFQKVLESNSPPKLYTLHSASPSLDYDDQSDCYGLDLLFEPSRINHEWNSLASEPFLQPNPKTSTDSEVDPTNSPSCDTSPLCSGSQISRNGSALVETSLSSNDLDSSLLSEPDSPHVSSQSSSRLGVDMGSLSFETPVESTQLPVIVVTDPLELQTEVDDHPDNILTLDTSTSTGLGLEVVEAPSCEMKEPPEPKSDTSEVNQLPTGCPDSTELSSCDGPALSHQPQLDSILGTTLPSFMSTGELSLTRMGSPFEGIKLRSRESQDSASAIMPFGEGDPLLAFALDNDSPCAGDELARLRAVFDALDRDKDGFVKMEDFVQFATVYGAEQVKYLTGYLDPAGLGVINFRDFYRGISEIQNEDLDMQLYDMGYPSEEEPACSVDFDDLAAFEVTEVTDSAYVGSESAYSECETFTDEDTGGLAAQEDTEAEGDGAGSRGRAPATPEGLELSLCDISGITVTGQEEQFEDFGEGAEPDMFNSHCEEEQESFTQTTNTSQRLTSSPDKRTSSRKEARRLHHSGFLEDQGEQPLSNMACDDTDLTDKVLYLEQRVSELERDSAMTGEQQNRLRQENLHLLHRAHALEEQLKDQEVRSDEVQSEETRKHRDELRKMERDRGFRLSSLKARVQELENENTELRSQLPSAKATSQRLEEEKYKLLDQVEELQRQLKDHQEQNKKLGGKLSKEKHKQQTEKERCQEVIEELRRELEQTQLLRLEMEQRMGLGNTAALQEYNSRTREAELEQEVRRLKQEQRLLKEQNEELNGQIINLSIQGAKNLFSTTFSDSLAAEISSVSRDELMEAIQKQEEINLRLQDYIDRIIVAIMETNPAILEVKIH